MVITNILPTRAIWNIFNYWLHWKCAWHTLTLLSDSLNGQRPICSFFENPTSAHKMTPKLGFCYLHIAYIKYKHARYKHPSSLNGKSPSESRGTTVPRPNIHMVKLFLALWLMSLHLISQSIPKLTWVCLYVLPVCTLHTYPAMSNLWQYLDTTIFSLLHFNSWCLCIFSSILSIN